MLSLAIQRLLDDFAWQAMGAEFRFDPDMPMLVSITFMAGPGPRVTWSVSRELVYRGLHELSGSGDVQMWPVGSADGATARLLLESPDMSSLFELPARPLARWLDSTYRTTPRQDEMAGLDWDSFIADILDGAEEM
ncbi:SsgA family sporulation/cell division regulator [Streptomyces dioscori]|uniref:SsgA family sporulation/cell division regulator n=1 Tax=Streptomyces dioscori TaxID=2109333 RepID=UPI001CECEB42|nr:SsgA family sporulation/cell division regulator [Streptomyces dioscori]